MNETLKAQIKAFGMGRIGLGAAAVVAPGLVIRVLLGKGPIDARSKMLLRMVGGRDIALGLGVVFALNHEAPVRGWLEAGTVADSGDFVATVLAFRRLRPGAAMANAVAALGGAAYGRYLASAIQPASQGASGGAAGPASETHPVP